MVVTAEHIDHAGNKQPDPPTQTAAAGCLLLQPCLHPRLQVAVAAKCSLAAALVLLKHVEHGSQVCTEGAGMVHTPQASVYVDRRRRTWRVCTFGVCASSGMLYELFLNTCNRKAPHSTATGDMLALQRGRYCSMQAC